VCGGNREAICLALFYGRKEKFYVIGIEICGQAAQKITRAASNTVRPQSNRAQKQ
jgi:hypothetical protein